MSNLFVRVNEKQYGPFSRQEVRGMVRQGKFSAKDLVWHEEQDQWVEASTLRDGCWLFADECPVPERRQRAIAVAGGKGGVGKTVITASLGVGLASLGYQVVMVDADLGGANLHTVMGILEPAHTFFDFYTTQVESLKDVVLETPVKNLGLISGACGTLGLANPKYYQKQRFIRELRTIPAEFLLLDLGAGSSYNVIDFFLAADEGIVVTNPEPMAVQECFNFIKICLLRKLKLAFRQQEKVMAILDSDELSRPGRIEAPMMQVLEKVRAADETAGALMEQVLDAFQPRLILNMMDNPDDAKEGWTIQTAAAELLGVDVEFLGCVSADQTVRQAVRELRPFLLHNPKGQAAQDLAKLINVKLLGKSSLKNFLDKRRLKKTLRDMQGVVPATNLREHAPICSAKCFYWGDCDFQNGGQLCPVRHVEVMFKT
jgi:flagellar biosynthesis protein FlhG